MSALNAEVNDEMLPIHKECIVAHLPTYTTMEIKQGSEVIVQELAVLLALDLERASRSKHF